MDLDLFLNVAYTVCMSFLACYIVNFVIKIICNLKK
jgi:hypothetical protein